MDPFFNECRAYGRLVEANQNGRIAVRCHGHMSVPAAVEEELARRFGVRTWDRPEEEYARPVPGRQPFRAVVKDLVREPVPWTHKVAKKMLKDLKAMRRLGVYPMDVGARNYEAGLLVDMSIAITTPHYRFDLRPRWQVRVMQREDLLMFDKVCTLFPERFLSLSTPCLDSEPKKQRREKVEKKKKEILTRKRGVDDRRRKGQHVGKGATEQELLRQASVPNSQEPSASLGGTWKPPFALPPSPRSRAEEPPCAAFVPRSSCPGTPVSSLTSHESRSGGLKEREYTRERSKTSYTDDETPRRVSRKRKGGPNCGGLFLV